MTRASSSSSSSSSSSGSALALLAVADDLSPAALSLVERATPEEREALVEALRAAHQRGRDEGDRRSALQLARIFGALVGMEPAADRGEQADRGLARRVVERFRRGG